MARMTDVRSVAANTKVDNVLSGKIHEFLAVQSLVRLLAVGSAAGLRVSLLIGSEVIVDDQEISSANRYPNFPDDVVAESAGFAKDRIVLSVRNTTAGALTANTVLDTIPI